jgi:hypothetical protein
MIRALAPHAAPQAQSTPRRAGWNHHRSLFVDVFDLCTPTLQEGLRAPATAGSASPAVRLLGDDIHICCLPFYDRRAGTLKLDAQTADGGATFSELLAMLKQRLCVGCVNKALSKIFRENLYKLLLCCRNVMHDPGELRKVRM